MRNGLPSGDQIEIRVGDKLAVVVTVGAGLRSYAVGGRAVVDGYGPDEMASAGRGQVLIPWPNRIEDGSYEFGGRWHHLPLTEPEANNAIHGLVRWVAWSVAAHEADRVALEHTLYPQPGYPFSLALSVEYTLGAGGLRVTSSATNIGNERCPYGSGQHPYVTLGTDRVDGLLLRAPGGTVLEANGRGLPVSAATVDGTEYDFREPRPIGSTRLDHAFTDLTRDADGAARVELRDPGGERTLTLWLDGSFDYLQLFTGDPLPSVNRRSLAVEPMTCAPNAFRTGAGLLVLEPGESTTSTWGIQA